jgi:hypothetical protein
MGWLMTPSSLDRESHYDTVTMWHVNTGYVGFLVRIYETKDPQLLGSRVFLNVGGFPDKLAQLWAEDSIARYDQTNAPELSLIFGFEVA